MKTTCDAAVIGAGVFGSWTAYWLAEAGYKVVVIDAHGPANPRASSGDETRIIRMSYGADELYTRMSLRSLSAWKRRFPEFFHGTGVLFTAGRGDAYIRASQATLARVRVPHEALDSRALARRFPQMRLGRGSIGVYEPESGVLMARRAVAAVLQASRAKYEENEAVALERGGVRTSRGETIRAGVYVFACGPWLPKLFPGILGGRIRPTRQEVFYFGRPAGARQFTPPQMPAWVDFAAGAYGVPDITGSGLKVGMDRHGPAFDPETGDRTITRARYAEARALVHRRFPAMQDAPLVGSRVCQYENTSNGDLLIDRHPDFANVWLVGGGSGHGFKHGPAVGDYVVARIEGRGEVEPRFSLATKGRRARRTVY